MRRKGPVISDFFNMDVLFGILLGIAVPFVVWVATQDIPVAVDKAPVQPDIVVHAYQDLIAGIMALIGAAAAVAAVMHQIRQTREIENERRERRNYAARAMMPHALASLCTYARGCSDALRSVVDEAPSPHLADVHWPDHVAIPALPDAAMATLKECIEFGDREIQLRLAKLIEQLQIQHVRVIEPHHIFDRIEGDWYYQMIEDALEIHARATMLFDYARRRNENAPASQRPRTYTMHFSHAVST